MQPLSTVGSGRLCGGFCHFEMPNRGVLRNCSKRTNSQENGKPRSRNNGPLSQIAQTAYITKPAALVEGKTLTPLPNDLETVTYARKMCYKAKLPGLGVLSKSE